MSLSPVTESLIAGEDHTWLADKHALSTAASGLLDGAALAAIYTDGIAKSGTILAKNTTTKRFVPYDQATSANGLNVVAGILFTTKKVSNGIGGVFNIPGAVLLGGGVHIYLAKLPRAANLVGGPHADAVTALKALGFIIR